jgi:hypothetical protein
MAEVQWTFRLSVSEESEIVRFLTRTDEQFHEPLSQGTIPRKRVGNCPCGWQVRYVDGKYACKVCKKTMSAVELAWVVTETRGRWEAAEKDWAPVGRGWTV